MWTGQDCERRNTRSKHEQANLDGEDTEIVGAVVHGHAVRRKPGLDLRQKKRQRPPLTVECHARSTQIPRCLRQCFYTTETGGIVEISGHQLLLDPEPSVGGVEATGGEVEPGRPYVAHAYKNDWQSREQVLQKPLSVHHFAALRCMHGRNPFEN